MMQPFLILTSMLAMLLTTVPVDKMSVGILSLQKSSAALRAQPHSSEIAAIEAYSKMLDRYFKSRPQLARFYVDALPEEKAASSPAGKKEWYEVKNQNEMSDAEREYATRSLIVSTKDGEIAYANLGEPREHSRHDTEYYFRSDQTLAKISSNYYSNVAGIHVTRENFYAANGKLLRATTQCFNIIFGSRRNREKSASCKKTEMREELSDYKFPVYKKISELPGYDILKSR